MPQSLHGAAEVPGSFHQGFPAATLLRIGILDGCGQLRLPLRLRPRRGETPAV